jgi:peptidoglycan/LPS O-acetylase OafA/YrhL
MQRERIEYSNVPLGRAEPEDEVDVNAGDCQALLPCAHSDPSHENASERLKEEVIVCVVDPTEKDKANLTATKSTPTQLIDGGHLPFLDGLRGLAVLTLVQELLAYLPDFRLGLYLADGYFVLSAFLLTMSFERKCRQLLAQRAPLIKWATMLADYFCKRFFRVYPMVVVVALTLAYIPVGDLKRFYCVDAPFNVFEVLSFKFESRFYVLWTVPIQIAYYFVIPVFVAVLLALRRHWWVLVLPLYVWVIDEGINNTRGHHMPLRPHLPTFVAGSLAAVVYSRLNQSIKNNAFEFSWRHQLAVRAFEGAIMFLVLSQMIHGLLFDWIFENRYGNTYEFPFVSMSISALIVIEILLPSALASFLEWNFLRYAGKISYSLYLLHPFVIHNLTIMDQPDKYDQFFLNFGGSIALATIGYWMVENPSQLAAQRVSKLLAHVGTRSPTLAL